MALDLLMILCRPTSMPMEIPGSEITMCEVCGDVQVWVSPKKSDIRQRAVNARFMCPACVGMLSHINNIDPLKEIIDITKTDISEYLDKKKEGN